jgi:glyoxylase-like metal-dependent hydrolase (beta-lactamase superfamily II)
VNAIGQREKDPISGEVLSSFPVPLEDTVYFCGFANELTYGAASYLIVHPEGNILVDVPRFYPKLIQGIEKLGGVRYIFLTHSDDIAGHEKFAAHFQAERIMHAAERVPPGIERVIEAEGSIRLGDDFEIIATPGHTKGSMCLLYKNEILFSGDHLAGGKNGGLISFRAACWYSWDAVKRSNEKLLDFEFSRVYPGHGRRFTAVDSLAAKRALKDLVAKM